MIRYKVDVCDVVLQVPMGWCIKADTRQQGRLLLWRKSVWRVRRRGFPAPLSEKCLCFRSWNIPTLFGTPPFGGGEASNSVESKCWNGRQMVLANKSNTLCYWEIEKEKNNGKGRLYSYKLYLMIPDLANVWSHTTEQQMELLMHLKHQ